MIYKNTGGYAPVSGNGVLEAPDLKEEMLAIASAAISVGNTVQIDVGDSSGATVPFGRKVKKAVSGTSASADERSTVGVYEGLGSPTGADNTALTYVGATTTAVPGKAAVTGDLIRITVRGYAFAWASAAGGSIGQGDALSVVDVGGTAAADGILVQAATVNGPGVPARIVAMVANAQGGTAGSGQATKVWLP